MINGTGQKSWGISQELDESCTNLKELEQILESALKTLEKLPQDIRPLDICLLRLLVPQKRPTDIRPRGNCHANKGKDN